MLHKGRDPRLKALNTTAAAASPQASSTVEIVKVISLHNPDPLDPSDRPRPDSSPRSPLSSSATSSAATSSTEPISTWRHYHVVPRQPSQDAIFLGIRSLSISPVLDEDVKSTGPVTSDTRLGRPSAPPTVIEDPLEPAAHLEVCRKLEITREQLDTEQANLRAAINDKRRVHSDLESSRANYVELWQEERKIHWENVALRKAKQGLEEENVKLAEGKQVTEKEKMALRMEMLEMTQAKVEKARSLEESEDVRQKLQTAFDDASQRLDQLRLDLEKQKQETETEKLATEASLQKSLNESNSAKQRLASALEDALGRHDHKVQSQVEAEKQKASLETSLEESAAERQTLGPRQKLLALQTRVDQLVAQQKSFKIESSVLNRDRHALRLRVTALETIKEDLEPRLALSEQSRSGLEQSLRNAIHAAGKRQKETNEEFASRLVSVEIQYRRKEALIRKDLAAETEKARAAASDRSMLQEHNDALHIEIAGASDRRLRVDTQLDQATVTVAEISSSFTLQARAAKSVVGKLGANLHETRRQSLLASKTQQEHA